MPSLPRPATHLTQAQPACLYNFSRPLSPSCNPYAHTARPLISFAAFLLRQLRPSLKLFCSQHLLPAIASSACTTAAYSLTSASNTSALLTRERTQTPAADPLPSRPQPGLHHLHPSHKPPAHTTAFQPIQPWPHPSLLPKGLLSTQHSPSPLPSTENPFSCIISVKLLTLCCSLLPRQSQPWGCLLSPSSLTADDNSYAGAI